MDESLLKSLKEKYKDVHPLIFHRSLEKAGSITELFDILDTLPKIPFYWDDSNKKWSKCLDFICQKQAKSIISKSN